MGSTSGPATLHVAFELGAARWVIMSTIGVGQRPRGKTVPAGDRAAVQAELARAKERFGLPGEAPVVSCYEAGRDGFWLHRWLGTLGVHNVVVDSSSIRVPRRARRAKTDRLDAAALLGLLLRATAGERAVWSVVRVPAPTAEAARQPQRELQGLQQEETRLRNRMRSLVALHGVRLSGRLAQWPRELAALRQWDGRALSPELQAQLGRAWDRLALVQQQIRAVQRARRVHLRQGQTPASAQVRQLMQLRGIGEASAWLFSTELFAWRQFRNRREVGAMVGFTPTPFDSGTTRREQGISKAGPPAVRAMAVEIAWAWLRYQPRSELSQWYERRFGHGSSRLRRIGIVALARKLLIALWRYLDQGTVPTGASVKPAPARVQPAGAH
jgi:transposase